MQKLEMDNPIELNKQVIMEEALQKERDELASAAELEENLLLGINWLP